MTNSANIAVTNFVDADDADVVISAKSAHSRSRATSAHKSKRVYVPVFVPEKQKKKSKI